MAVQWSVVSRVENCTRTQADVVSRRPAGLAADVYGSGLSLEEDCCP